MPRKDPRRLPHPGTANGYLQDRMIRHALYIERLKTTEVRKMLAYFNGELVPELEARIAAELNRIVAGRSPSTLVRLRRTQKIIRKTINAGTKEMARRSATSMMQLGLFESHFAADALTEAVPYEVRALLHERGHPGLTGTTQAGPGAVPIVVAQAPTTAALKITFNEPSQQIIRAIVRNTPVRGEFVPKWFQGLGDNLQNDIMRQVRTGLVEGRSIPDMTRAIRGSRSTAYADGLISKARHQVEALVRTTVNHTVTQARQATYKEAGDIVKKWRFLATLDARTTVICASQDGKTYPLNSGPLPPLHINCRSVDMPVTASLKELGIPGGNVKPTTRASMNGQVPATVNYPQWLRQMDSNPATRHIVDDALGKTKARWFRSGRVKIEKFVGADNRPLTLNQIARNEGLTLDR